MARYGSILFGFLALILTVQGQLDCDFEETKPTCGWKQEQGTGFYQWTKHAGRTSSSGTGPNADHTTGRGFYLYVEASSPRIYHDKFRLISPWFGDNQSFPMCFSMWYNMNGIHMGDLSVYVRENPTQSLGTQVWLMYGNQGSSWKQMEVTLNYNTSISVVIEGLIGKGIEGDMAIDDISVYPAACGTTVPPTATPNVTASGVSSSGGVIQTLPPHSTMTIQDIQSALDCDFNKDLCHWQQARDDRFDWTRHSGSTGSSGTGPTKDHSGIGYYLYIETSSPRRTGDEAKLVSQTIYPGRNESFCLSFWFDMYGSTLGSLTVTSARQMGGGNFQNTTLFHRKTISKQSWIAKNVTVSQPGPLNIVFGATRGTNYYSDIAIDDIKVYPGRCANTVPLVG